MKTKKAKEFILGIFTAIGLWIFGHLLSGRLMFVEELELYPTGPLVFLFPFAFAAACILIAKYSVKNNKQTYFKTSLISFFNPFICILLALLTQMLAENTRPMTLFRIVAEILNIIFVLPIISLISIISQMFNAMDNLSETAALIIILANLIPIIAGAIISIRIFIKGKKLPTTDTNSL